MTTTIEYLDALKSKLGAVSDYDLAKKMNVTRAAISSYRIGRSNFDDEMCLKVASLLDVPAFEVLINVHAERSHNPLVKASFKQVLKQLATTAAVCLITTGFNLVSPIPAYSSEIVPTDNSIYIMRSYESV